ncbi:MAG TPA: hypothetical protein VGE21_05460 [Flavobacteriales bacterium]
MLAGPFAVLLAILFVAHPFLAITELSGGDTLVVEGWMEPRELEQAAVLAQSPTYHRIYTTGTIRPFAYYLGTNEGLRTILERPSGGELRINAGGTGDAGFRVIAGTDTVIDVAVPAQPREFTARLPAATTEIRILSWNSKPNTGPGPNVFISSARIDRTNLHRLQREVMFIRPNGYRVISLIPAWPTYAHSAKAKLEELGVPAQRITAVPSYGRPDSRTWANASHFAVQAKADGLKAFDIATVGVHARRSRSLFQEACGADIRAGVISIPDPYCTADNWWRSVRGWGTMLKEIIGAPEVQAVELTR